MNKVGVPRGLQRGERLRPDSAGLPDRPPGRRRHHLHRRDPHRRPIMKAAADESRRCRWRWAARTPPWCSPTATSDNAVGRGHPALRLPERRPGLPGHRARVRRAPDLRQVRRRPEGGAEAMKIGVPFDRTPTSARWSARAPGEGAVLPPKAPSKKGATVVTGGGVPACRRRARRWLLGAADHLDRPARDRPRDHRTRSSAVLPTSPLRQRGRGAGQVPTTTDYGLACVSGRRTSARATASRRWKWASPGSTAGSCATCAPLVAQAVGHRPVRAVCTRSSSTPT